MEILKVDRLTKSFRNDISMKSTAVLRGVTFSAFEGEILGFLGPNGAGKTTTIKIILGLMRPDGGKVKILGRPAQDRAVKGQVGYLPENPFFYPHLSLREFMDFCGRMSGIPKKALKGRIFDIISRVGLEGKEDRRLSGFSKGMTQRVGLAQAVLHDPDILILDEPFSGLDPLGRKLVRDFLFGLREKGKTIFFSSHILPDMEALCDRTCIIRNGIVTRQLNMEELLRLGEGRTEITVRDYRDELSEKIEDYTGYVKISGEEAFIEVKNRNYLRTVMKFLLDNGVEVIEVLNQHPSLEEVFMGEMEGDKTEGASVHEVDSENERACAR